MESSKGQSRGNQGGKNKRKKGRNKRRRNRRREEKQKKAKKKKKTMKIKKVAEKWEIWDEKKKAARLEEETKKLVLEKIYKWIHIFGKKASKQISTRKL